MQLKGTATINFIGRKSQTASSIILHLIAALVSVKEDYVGSQNVMLDLSRVEHRLCVPVFCFASLFAVSTPSISHLLFCEIMISKLE